MTLNPAEALVAGKCIAHAGNAIYRERDGKLMYWCEYTRAWLVSSMDKRRENLWSAPGWREVEDPEVVT